MSYFGALGFIALGAIGIIIMEKLSDIARVNRALARGKAAEIKQAWKLHELYSRAEEELSANTSTISKEYHRLSHEIMSTHALIADAYDPNEGTRNIDEMLGQRVASSSE
jgi:hypothetical protein